MRHGNNDAWLQHEVALYIINNPFKTVTQLSEEFGCHYRTVNKVLNQLNIPRLGESGCVSSMPVKAKEYV